MRKNIWRTVMLNAFALTLMVSCNNSENNETKQEVPAVTVNKENDNITLYGLTDLTNEMSIDLFRGSADDKLLESLMPNGSLPSAINAFLAVDSTHTVLFDAGVGADKGGHLLESLKEAGVEPSQVTAVCLTHLHPDHIGGLLHDGKATFPNATLYLSEEECDNNLVSSPLATNELWSQVAEAYKGRIATFGDVTVLFDGMVVALKAPGHTPGHTIYNVGNCFIVGDVLHAQDLQIEHPEFCARYDELPEQAVNTRLLVLELIRRNHCTMAGAHCHDHFIHLKNNRSEQTE